MSPALVTYTDIAELFGHALELSGTPDQLTRYLSRLNAGEVGAYALTDAGPGSDPGAMSSRAERHGDTYRLHGAQPHITHSTSPTSS